MIAHAKSGRASEAGILTREPGASIAYHRHVARNNAGRVRPGIVFLGGFASDMTGSKATTLDRFAGERGQAFVRFDYQGHGASSGRIEEGGIETWRDDALAVIDHLTEGPQILVGSSMGGWIMQLVALARPGLVAGLIGIATATDFTEALIWAALPDAERRKLEEQGTIRIPTPHDPRGYLVSRCLIEEGRRYLLLDKPIPIHCPVRLFHGTADTAVPWSLSAKLVAQLESTDVTLTLVKNAEHRLSSDADLQRLQFAVAELSDGHIKDGHIKDGHIKDGHVQDSGGFMSVVAEVGRAPR